MLCIGHTSGTHILQHEQHERIILHGARCKRDDIGEPGNPGHEQNPFGRHTGCITPDKMKAVSTLSDPGNYTVEFSDDTGLLTFSRPAPGSFFIGKRRPIADTSVPNTGRKSNAGRFRPRDLYAILQGFYGTVVGTRSTRQHEHFV